MVVEVGAASCAVAASEPAFLLFRFLCGTWCTAPSVMVGADLPVEDDPEEGGIVKGLGLEAGTKQGQGDIEGWEAAVIRELE